MFSWETLEFLKDFRTFRSLEIIVSEVSSGETLELLKDFRTCRLVEIILLELTFELLINFQECTLSMCFLKERKLAKEALQPSV